MSVKRDFIEAVRLTPDGIQDFLETPIPAAPTISTPADVDAAIIASGVLSKFLLDLFAPFEGLTPIELLLRIGQHNNVLESAMLAGLEYIEGADPDSNVITILEPEDGLSYTPGEMRFSASVANGFCLGMMLVINDGDPMKMIEKDGTWQQYVNMEIGEQSATCTASFEDLSEQSASVSFTIAEYTPDPPPPEPPIPPEQQPKPPGGTDNAALIRAKAIVLLTYGDVIKNARNTLTFGLDDVQAFFAAITTFLSLCPDTQFIIFAKDRIQTHGDALTAAIMALNGDAIITESSAIMTEINTIYAVLTK
jgi:hypothetical protein